MSTTTTASTNTNSANTAATTNGPSNSSPTPTRLLPPLSLSPVGAGHDRSPSKDGFLHQNQMLYHGYSASDGLFEVDVDDLVPVVEEEPSIKEPSPIMVEVAAKIKIRLGDDESAARVLRLYHLRSYVRTSHHERRSLVR